MRLAYLVLDPGIPVGSSKGAAVHVEAITSALQAAGHEVVIFAAHVSDRRPTCRVELVQLPAEFRRGAKAIKNLVASTLPDYRLDRDVRALLLNAAATDFLTDRLAALGVTTVLERLSLFGSAGLQAAHAVGIPHTTEMNAPLADEAQRYRGLVAASLARACERQVLLGTDAVFPVSKSLADYCRRLGVPDARIAVVPNGVDLSAFAPRGDGAEVRSALGISPDDCVVGMVSGLRPWHGGLDCVRAFVEIGAREPRARLLIVGDGPERESMAEMISHAGMTDRVHFTGPVPHAAIPAHLEALDVALAPYRPAAGFYYSPLKIYEYMAMGKAIVASDLGQISAVIANGITGRLVPPGNVPAMTDAIADLLANEGERTRLGAAARLAAAEHDWSRAATRIEIRLFGLIEGAGAQELPCSV